VALVVVDVGVERGPLLLLQLHCRLNRNGIKYRLFGMNGGLEASMANPSRLVATQLCEDFAAMPGWQLRFFCDEQYRSRSAGLDCALSELWPAQSDGVSAPWRDLPMR
jgi:hypothetical protein